jgi:hypothetical protein
MSRRHAASCRTAESGATTVGVSSGGASRGARRVRVSSVCRSGFEPQAPHLSIPIAREPPQATSLPLMALRPEEFYDHALAAADSERRLPLSRMTGWEISPFEHEGLRVAPLRPPVLPETARDGEDPADCSSCRRGDEGIWFSDRWRLTRIQGTGVPLVLMLHPRDHYDMGDLPDELAAELGVLNAHIVRHMEALPHIARAHIYRIGDGGAHLHIWFFARPQGQAQLYGSWMVVWDDLLPEYPADVADADAVVVADALLASFGGRRP